MASDKLIAQSELANRLGCGSRSIRNYVELGMPKVGEGRTAKHPWPECRVWYDNYIREQERKKGPPDDLKDLRRRRQEADTRLAEIDVAKAEGLLIPFEVHERRVEAICDRLRAAVMVIPSKALARIIQARDNASAQAAGEAIRDELLVALRGTADEIVDEDEGEPPEEIADVSGAA